MPATCPTTAFLASSLTVIINYRLAEEPDGDWAPVYQFGLDAGKLSILEDSDIDALTAVYVNRATTAMPTAAIQHIRQWGYGTPTFAEDPVDDQDPTPAVPDGEEATAGAN